MTTDQLAVAALVSWQMAVEAGELPAVWQPLKEDAERAIRAAQRQGYDIEPILAAVSEAMGWEDTALFQSCALPEPPRSMGCPRAGRRWWGVFSVS